MLAENRASEKIKISFKIKGLRAISKINLEKSKTIAHVQKRRKNAEKTKGVDDMQDSVRIDILKSGGPCHGFTYSVYVNWECVAKTATLNAAKNAANEYHGTIHFGGGLK